MASSFVKRHRRCRLIFPNSSVMPITVTSRSNTVIVGSNPTQDMDICIVRVYSVFMLFCV
jgi:hypothetical protein